MQQKGNKLRTEDKESERTEEMEREKLTFNSIKLECLLFYQQTSCLCALCMHCMYTELWPWRGVSRGEARLHNPGGPEVRLSQLCTIHIQYVQAEPWLLRCEGLIKK